MSIEDPVLETQIMHVLLDIIHETHTELPRDDKSILELVEVRPRSSRFAKVPLSCSISPNDPADPGGWADEELASPGQKYNLYSGGKFLEMGLGQYFNLRYTIDLTMFFLDKGIERDEALILAHRIIARIHKAIIMAGQARDGAFSSLFSGDERGAYLVNANRSVKKRELRPGGSARKTLAKARMWLQFEAYYEL